MTTMKKIIIASVFALMCLLPVVSYASHGPSHPVQPVNYTSTPTPVQPVNTKPAPIVPVQATGGIQNPLKGADSLGELFNTLAQFAIDVAYVVIAAFLLLSGFKFIKAQGNPEELTNAKKTFWYTIVGALIIIGMDTMISVFKSILEQLAG